MSYFGASAISIDRERQMFRVKGGDNNVVPRMSYWTDWRSLRGLLPALSGGGLQLTTRSERAVHIDTAARLANRGLRDLTGVSGYELASILRGDDRAELAERYRQDIADWRGSWGAHMSADYVAARIAGLERLLNILGDPIQLDAIDAVHASFCCSACQPVQHGTHVVTNGYSYVSGTYRGGAYTTTSLAAAKRYSEDKAREVAARFTGWTAQAVGG